MNLGKSRVIRLLLTTLFLTLLPVQSQALPINSPYLEGDPGSKFLQSSIQVFGKDLNNNKIEDSLEAEVSSLGSGTIAVLIQTSNYVATISQLSNFGITASLVSALVNYLRHRR